VVAVHQRVFRFGRDFNLAVPEFVAQKFERHWCLFAKAEQADFAGLGMVTEVEMNMHAEKR